MALALLLGRLLLAAVFLAAAMAKLRDLPGSRGAMGEFAVPARAAGVLGTLLPLAELAITGALIAGPTASSGALAALILLLLFCVAIAWNLSHGRAPDCHCFGQLHSTPASRRTVARNLGLAAIAFLLATGLGALAPAAAIAAVGIAALVAGPLPAWLRRGDGGETTAGDAAGAPEGLPVGTPAPDFRLPGLSGGSHTLDSLRADGRPLLLLFSDHNCGPCIEMAPMVARWQREHSDELTIAVLERDHDGDAVAPDEHGRRDVLLQRESEVSGAYGAQGTPTAVLVGGDGAIASPVAAGGKEIEALMARTVDTFVSRLPTVLPVRPALGRPLRRRELLVRAAGAWAATSAVLAWPLRAAAGLAPSARRAEPCEDVFDCPDPGHMRCQVGRCRCQGGLTRCDPREATTQRCFDLQRSRDHCGGCNRPCADDQCCEGRCQPFGSNRCNCGGEICDSGEVCRDVLVGGGSFESRCVPCPNAVDGTPLRQCGNSCGDPRTQRCCGDRLYETSELGPGDWRCCGPEDDRRLVNVREHERHCGGCNQPCGQGRFCYQGRCRTRCPRGLKRCGNTCGDPRRQTCCRGKLYSKESGVKNCRGRCKPTKSDPRNCGGCGTRCSGPFDTGECCNGKCCDINGSTCCPGGCKNTSLDNNNCGACGNVCPPNSFCRFGTCTAF